MTLEDAIEEAKRAKTLLLMIGKSVSIMECGLCPYDLTDSQAPTRRQPVPPACAVRGARGCTRKMMELGHCGLSSLGKWKCELCPVPKTYYRDLMKRPDVVELATQSGGGCTSSYLVFAIVGRGFEGSL